MLFSCSFIFLLLFALQLKAQPCTSYLSGTYTVGTGGDYSTLTAAANAYNTSCITANVTFVLTNATYTAPTETFPINFSRNTTAGPSTRLSIVPQSGLSVTISGSVNSGAIIKVNSSYIEFNGRGNADTSRNLFISNLAPLEPRVFHFGSAGASAAVTNCVISNCLLTNGTSDKSVILISDASSFNTPGYFNNITIQKNVFRKSLYGIYCLGATVAANGNGLLIANNDFNATGSNAITYSAIYLKGVDGATVINNNIGNFLGTDTSSDKGIILADTVRNTLVAGNKIFNLNNISARGWGAHGIYIGTNLPNANITVMNNMIGNISGDGNDYTNANYTLENPSGILLSCSSTQGGIRIYNNTIALGNVSGFSNTLNRVGAVSSCIRLRTGSSAEIKNNVLYNTLGLAGASGFGATCILLSQSANQISVLDYNDYYVAPSGAGVKLLGHIFTGNVQSTTLASWRTATSKDINSTNIMPLFVSNADLHLSESGNNLLNNTGSYIAGYSYDIDSTSRGTIKVDVGCDEFVPANTVNWIGKYTSDWFNPLNWEANIMPNATKDLSLSSGSPNLPALNSQSAVRNLQLSATGSSTLLTLGPNGYFQIYGILSRTNGVVDAMEGTIELSGSTAQNIPLSFFKSNGVKDFLISNSSVTGVTIDGPLDIYRSMKFSTTGIRLNTNDHLTLKSGLNQTAWVGDLTGKTINGKVTVERYIPTGVNHGKSWQLLNAPIYGNQTINQAWQDSATAPNQNRYPGFGTQITGNSGGNSTVALASGFDVYTPAGSTVKTYNAVNDNWQFISNTNATSVSNTKGYFVFVRGDRSVTTYNAAAVSTVLRAKGNLYTAQPGSLPPAVNVLPNAFESVGNPYASTIDFTQLVRNGAVDPVFYVWDPLLTGTNGLGGFQFISAANGYKPLPGGTSNYNNSVSYPFIQSGQAFLIHSNSSGGTLSFNETVKTEGSSTTFREESDQQHLQIILSSFSNNHLNTLDASALGISNIFSNDDDEYDVTKVNNPGENLSIKMQNKSFSLLANQSWNAIDTIHLLLNNIRSSSYRFTFHADGVNDEGYGLFLTDRYLHEEMLIASDDTTLIDFLITNDTLSKASDRFYLVRKPISVLPVLFENAQVIKWEKNANRINWEFSDLSQVERFEIEKSFNGKDFFTCGVREAAALSQQFYVDHQYQEGACFYRIKATISNNQFLYSKVLIVQNVSQHSPPVFISDKGNQKIHLESSQYPNGSYWINLYMSDGALVKRIEMQVSDNQLNRYIQLPPTISNKLVIFQIADKNKSSAFFNASLFIQ